jgi:adhesin transport system outer membrane protein
VQHEALYQGQTLAGDELVASYREQFRLARRSLLDLLNVQGEAHSYATAAVQAQFDRRVARYRLAAATGRLASAAR